MPKIINIPDFMEVEILDKNFNFLQTLLLFIKSRILILIFKYSNGILFCKLFNLFYKSDGKIYFKDSLYYKKINDRNFYFPNKRITRIAVNHKKHLQKFLQTYCIDFVDLKDGDLVVDCGANVGELALGLKTNCKKINYIGFEPDLRAYKCLEKNIENEDTIYNLALSNVDGKQDLFVDTDGGNSSLSYFGTEIKSKIESRTFDSFKFKNIKLLKIDGEGFEPEILSGCIKSLSEIEYISVDYGNERGLESSSTIVAVLNFLYDNNFRLIKESDYRKIGLFKNQDF